MTRSDDTVCSYKSTAPLAGNTGLYVAGSVSAKQSGWLQNLWTNAGTCAQYKYLSAIPAAVTSDLKQRLIDTWALLSQKVIDEALVNGESGYVQAWRQKDITLNIC